MSQPTLDQGAIDATLGEGSRPDRGGNRTDRRRGRRAQRRDD